MKKGVNEITVALMNILTRYFHRAKCNKAGLNYSLTLGMLKQGRHAALSQDSSVLQQGSDEAPRGQLTQQVSQELNKTLTVQQLLLLLRTCQVCSFRLSFLHCCWIGFWCYLIQHLQAVCCGHHMLNVSSLGLVLHVDGQTVHTGNLNVSWKRKTAAQKHADAPCRSMSLSSVEQGSLRHA